MPLLLVLLAVMSKAPAQSGSGSMQAHPNELDATIRATAHSLFPFAERGAAPGKLPAQSVTRAIAKLSSLRAPGLASWRMPCWSRRPTRWVSGWRVSFPAISAKARGRHRGADRDCLQPCHRGRAADDRRGDQRDLESRSSWSAKRSTRAIWAMSQLNLAIHDVDGRGRVGRRLRRRPLPATPRGSCHLGSAVEPATAPCRRLTETRDGCGANRVPTMATRHGRSTASPTLPMTVEQ